MSKSKKKSHRKSRGNFPTKQPLATEETSNRKAAAKQKRSSGLDRERIYLFAIFVLISLVGCWIVTMFFQGGAEANYGYRVIKTFRHDPEAFTQGLIFADGKLYESTGLKGESSIRIVDLETGNVEKKYDLPDNIFGEGIALFGDKIYQLSWQDNKVFVFDKELNLLDEFFYPGEGWGLTHNGVNFFLSDGSEFIRVIDPETFEVLEMITVTRNGKPQYDLNELEFIEGYIYANVWERDYVVRIEPKTGKVTAVIDFKGLYPKGATRKSEDVLNGIAYDAKNGRIYVTGKNWPNLFQVEISPIAE